MTEYEEPESSDSLKEFGEIVRCFRERAEMPQGELAVRLGYSVHTVSSVEQGRRFPPPDFPPKADDVLDAFGTIKRAARHLSRNPGLANWFRQWAKLERDAITLCTYECRVIPGLLQTEAYMRAVFRNQVPPLKDAQLDARVGARLDRQRILTERQETSFSFIVEEALFRRRLGGDAVTHGMLNFVIEMAELRHIDVQVMPLERPNHAGDGGPVQLLETPESRWYAYCEGQRGGFLVSDVKEVSVLQRRYARMRSQALTPEDSVSLLTHLRGEL